MTQRLKVPKIIVALFLIQFIGFAAHAERVLMFYSSIGMGHLSAARAIEQNLKEENPNTEVMLYNIRDTIDPKMYEQFDEWLFWKVVKTFPNKFDQLFQKTMKKGMLSHAVPTDSIYSEEKMLEVINSFKPTHIISTHYGSTQKMIALRNKGSLLNIPIAWLHTDYFKGYFPRISKNIEMTFLGIDALMKQWTDEGVNPERIKTTGLPVNSSVFTPVDKEAVFKEQNLDPNKKTIVLMSGGEGVGNFPEIIKSISENVKTPIQIIAVCAKNKEHVEKLTALKPTLPQNVDLRIHGFVKNDLVLNWIKASDLYITKSGGLSPTEGFAINKPIVLLDVYGGHERENANLFERLGLAIVNRNEREIGKDVLRLMNNHELADKMLKEQLKFRNSFNLNAINRFVFDPTKQSMVPALNFGVESGTGVIDAEVALEKLERASPADIEIVLSYGKSDTGKVFRGDTNPFGHLAIKIDGIVYTMNGRAKKSDGENLVFETKLSDYLYSVERFIKNMEHTDAFGSAYARDNISLRVSGVSEEQKRMMLEYFAEVNRQFIEGKIGYNNANFNCADLVANALKRAGINSEYGKRKLTLPLDVLSDYKDYFENDPRYTTELALYQKASGSKNIFKSITFPISIYQLPRSLKNLIFNVKQYSFSNIFTNISSC